MGAKQVNYAICDATASCFFWINAFRLHEHDRKGFICSISATKIENFLNSVDCNLFENGIVLQIYEEFRGLYRALSNFYDGVFLWK